jgi:hypothetical protein
MKAVIVKIKQQPGFNIQTKQLRDWISKKPKLLKAQLSVKRINIGTKPKYPVLETTLVTWVKEKIKMQHASNEARAFSQQRQWQNMYSASYYYCATFT